MGEPTPPVGHYVRIFTLSPLGTRAGLDALLATLGRAGLVPTHWGREADPAPFDREAVIAKTIADAPTGLTLFGRDAPAFTCGLDALVEGFAAIAIELGPVADAAMPYRLGDELAAGFRALHALVHPRYDGRGRWNVAGRLEPQWLEKYGPADVAARTWYGEHLTALIGLERLRQAGELAEVAWGGVRLDLVAAPWTADADTLVRRQAEAMAVLGPSGAFGDYRDFSLLKRGPAWQPFPFPEEP